MHILVTNDDGPPSYQSSPYVQSFVAALQSAGHTVSVVLPHVQRSWIGKAHMVGQTLTPSYYRPGKILQDDGITQDRPFEDGKEEWILLDGTPASCTQIGLYHLFNDRDPIDLVVSGPNYGRNTTAVFALSSGTIGGAMEAAVSGKKAIALSFAFDSRDHSADIIDGSSRIAVKLIEKLVKEWPEDVHIYSINVPVREDVGQKKIVYAEMLQNTWTSGSSFTVLPEGTDDKDPNLEELKIREGAEQADKVKNGMIKRGHVTFKWSPNFSDVRKAVEEAKRGDGYEVIQGNVTVTPLRANYWHLPQYSGEIKLDEPGSSTISHPLGRLHAIIDYPEPYVQPLIERAFESFESLRFSILRSADDAAYSGHANVQFKAYEDLDFEQASQNPRSTLLCAYVIRKALIRKHYLSNTVASWLVKHPQSILARHFKSSVHFELDYAEFLDEALVDAWDLQESLSRNLSGDPGLPQEWWILKPGMSDGGNGIRLFSNLEQLQDIFEEWDPESEADEDADNLEVQQAQSKAADAAMTSQLRHFIAQPYIDPPLLLPAYDNRKFHIRTYVVSVGALKVYVYREMLALFAAGAYQSPQMVRDASEIDLGRHLTNTCFQDDVHRESSVYRFWDIGDSSTEEQWRDQIFGQICSITGETFEAAAREQMVHFQAIPNSFEIFGVDFLVDSSNNVWLLELNAYPDFKQTGKELKGIIGGLFEEVIKVAVAPFFGEVKHKAGTDQMHLVKSINLGRG